MNIGNSTSLTVKTLFTWAMNVLNGLNDWNVWNGVYPSP